MVIGKNCRVGDAARHARAADAEMCTLYRRSGTRAPVLTVGPVGAAWAGVLVSNSESAAAKQLLEAAQVMAQVRAPMRALRGCEHVAMCPCAMWRPSVGGRAERDCHKSKRALLVDARHEMIGGGENMPYSGYSPGCWSAQCRHYSCSDFVTIWDLLVTI